MSESKHTSGPWKARFIGEADCVIEGPWDDCGIANMVRWFPPFGLEEQKANARLIAASPDLLNACKMVFQWFQTTYPELVKNKSNLTIETLFDAITKAENNHGERLTIEQRRLAADVDRIKREIKRLTKLLEELKLEANHVNVH